MIINEDSFLFLQKDSISCDLVVTDPPYDLSSEQWINLLNLLNKVCKNDIIIFCDSDNLIPVKPTQWLFWLKQPSTKNFSKSYGSFVEMIAYYKKRGFVCPKETYWGNKTGIFTDQLEEIRIHEYQKPVSLLKRLIYNHSLPGEVVLDPFMGSGSTGIAAVELGRNFIGVEKDSNIFNLAKRRLECITKI